MTHVRVDSAIEVWGKTKAIFYGTSAASIHTLSHYLKKLCRIKLHMQIFNPIIQLKP